MRMRKGRVFSGRTQAATNVMDERNFVLQSLPVDDLPNQHQKNGRRPINHGGGSQG